MDDLEGDDEFDPEYARPSEAEGWRKLCAGILSGLLGLVLALAFLAAVCGMAEHLGGPLE